MPLFKHLRIHQIYGANTNVGKTIITTALVKTAKGPVHYLKPVSTGSDHDDAHVSRYTDIKTTCLFRYTQPLSPHLAVKLDEKNIPSDETFVSSVASFIRRCSPGQLYIETAGGVHSPTPSGTTQLDAYRPLFLPTILIGDPALGGISATISAYDALSLRGYTPDAVILFDGTPNAAYLTPYFAERGIQTFTLPPPPPRLPSPAEDAASTAAYYASLDLAAIHAHLDTSHTARIANLDSMSARALSALWWPFVQHAHVKDDVTVIDSAHSDYFSVYKDAAASASLLTPHLDSSASWWTQTLGHGHPRLAHAAAKAAGRYGHVMYPQAAHAPALTLAERLLASPGRSWASRVFFSDNGSTGMEVALKMALRTYTTRHGGGGGAHLGVVGLRGSYHGDTLGAMDACADDGVYTTEWHTPRGIWLDPPTLAFRDGQLGVRCPDGATHALPSLAAAYDVPARLHTPLAAAYTSLIAHTLSSTPSSSPYTPAVLLLEPLVLGAGGMRFVDPLFQRLLVAHARTHGLPVLYDEVFTGLYRLGHASASTRALLGPPDIAVYAKTLTGGVLPLAATLASEEVFGAFWGAERAGALLHGHSYSAHAVGCAVANETLDVVEREVVGGGAWEAARGMWGAGGAWSVWEPGFVGALSRARGVREVMTLGTVLAVTFEGAERGYTSQAAVHALRALNLPSDEYAIHFRTLGDVAYFMTSLNTAPATVRSLEDRVWRAVEGVQ